MRRATAGLPTLLALVLASGGCGKTAPAPAERTEAGGVVLLGGQPLPNATVTFTPAAAGASADAATAVTDANGRFKLMARPGAAVVTVTEGPVPDDLRDQDAQAKLAAFQAGLPNRPIPGKYGNTNTSKVLVTVTKDQKEYKVDLSR